MTLNIINVTVTEEAKQVLLDYQRAHNIRHQGTALDELLLELRELQANGEHQ